MMLIYIVVIFVLLHSPEFLVHLFLNHQETETKECVYIGYANRWYIEQSVFYLLMTIDSSVNGFIYCFKDQQFRQVAMDITGLKKLVGRIRGSNTETSLDIVSHIDQ